MSLLAYESLDEAISAIDRLHAQGLSCAEAFLERREELTETLAADGSHATSSVVGGVSIRGERDGRRVFGYASGLSPASVARAAAEVERLLGCARDDDYPVDSRSSATSPPTASCGSVMETAYDAARASCPHAYEARVQYGRVRREVLVLDPSGGARSHCAERARLSVTTMARRVDAQATGYDVIGVTGPDNFALTKATAAVVGATSGGRAARSLTALPAPTATVSVVLAAGAGAVLLHEACGHALEADLVAQNASVFADRIGSRIAPGSVTIIDDGQAQGGWGSAPFDDEGADAKPTILVEDGVLQRFMTDRARAVERSTGNGRRQDYRHAPLVRMTNTFIRPGVDEPRSVISDTTTGIYVTSMGGGDVDPTTGNFLFTMTEGYLIEDGVVTAPLRPATIAGNAVRALRNIDGVCDDFAWGMPASCGKQGQYVPVGVGQPTLRVHGLTVAANGSSG